MWNVKIHRLVLEEDLKKAGKKDREIILKTLYRKLATAPEKYGSPLKHTLKKYLKLKISGYRVIYKVNKRQVEVLVLKIGMRRDGEVYRKMLNRIKKTND